jgi:hypothetical protein
MPDHRGAVSYETAPPAGTVYSTPHVDVYATDETPREEAQVPAATGGGATGGHLQPARSRHPAVMPLFVLTVIALLLTSGTLVALVVHSGALKGPRVENAAREPTKAPPSPSANPSSAAPVLEGCLVGTWKTVSVEVLTFDQDQETRHVDERRRQALCRFVGRRHRDARTSPGSSTS